MTAVRSGIPTTFHSTNFRSRLEARWASFFDLIGWRWVYEPFDADGWIPDFLVAGDAPFLVEVGPVGLLSEFSQKAAKPIASLVPYVTLVAGISPTIIAPETAGYLTGDGADAESGCADWAVCIRCHTPAIFHQFGSFQLRPCGHSGDGTHIAALPESELFQFWARAGNRVQWQPRRRRAAR